MNAVGTQHKGSPKGSFSGKGSRNSLIMTTGDKRQSQFYEDSSPEEETWEDVDNGDYVNESAFKVEKPAPTAKAPIDPKQLIEMEINYILETEHKYVEVLQSMEKDREDLSETAPPFFRKWLSQLFRQVKALSSIHETLLINLGASKYDIVKFSEAFMLLKSHFTAYVYYIENIPTVDKIVAEYSSFLREQKPDLVDKLRQPRLRLNHYVLMVESLQKKVSETEKSHLQEVIAFCKNYLSQADKALLLGSIKGCPFSLYDCGEFKYRSDLKVTYSPDLPNKMYHLVLLERKLIIVRGSVDNFQYVHSIPVDEISLKHNSRGVYFSVIVNHSDKGYSHTYQFKTKNIKTQQLWISKLNEAIEALRASLVRTQGRTSFGRSGRKLRQSFASARKYIPKIRGNPSQSFYSDDSDSGEDQAQYWKSRRKAIRKYSSLSAKTPVRVTKQRSTAASDSEDIYYAYTHGMAPLTVWNFHQEIELLYRILRDPSSYQEYPIVLIERKECSVIDVSEKKYVSNLNRQLGEFLRDDIVKPPKDIRRNLKRLYAFHSTTLANHYENCSHTYDFETAFLQSLTTHGEEFAVLYSEYLSDRCDLQDKMLEMDLNDQYILPIKQFMLYCHCVILLSLDKHMDESLTTTAATVLHDTITAANNHLLAGYINNVPFALSQCQPILLVGRLKMRSDARHRQEYQVILVKDQVIILEILPPLYNFFCSLRLDNVSLGPSIDSFHFQLESKTANQVRKVFSFTAQRKEIRDRWVSEITMILEEQAKKLKEARSMRSEMAPNIDLSPSSCGLQTPPLHTIDLSRSPNLSKKISRPLETEL